MLESNGLPFDIVQRRLVEDFCRTTGYESQEAKSIYYKNKDDFILSSKKGLFPKEYEPTRPPELDDIKRLNHIETNGKLMINDVEKNTEFRIKWPRGELGSLPADSEQFMLIEHMSGVIDKHTEQLEGGMHNKVNIDFLKQQV